MRISPLAAAIGRLTDITTLDVVAIVNAANTAPSAEVLAAYRKTAHQD
jgi:O-acetyl-ADP-ribose deacetylase (regulator of RNase III)